ncbi:MAG: MCP four helix bundle domain-containing protein [Verrucomicrobiota bacterium]
MWNRLTFTMMSMVTIVLCVGRLAYGVITLVQRQAALMQAQTVQTLTYAAAINSDQAEAYARTLLALHTSDPVKREEYLTQVEDYSRQLSENLRNYRLAAGAADSPSLTLLDKLVVSRQKYVAIRSEVIALINQKQIPAAQQMADRQLWPTYQDYTAAGDALFANNVTVNQQRVEEIHRQIRLIKYATIGLCIFVFLAGATAPFLFLVGLERWVSGRANLDSGI